MTKEDDEDFKNSTKCWICDNDYVDNDVIKYHCHITGKWSGAAHRDCKINLKLNNFKLNHKVHNLKSFDSQELGKLNLKINVLPY